MSGEGGPTVEISQMLILSDLIFYIVYTNPEKLFQSVLKKRLSKKNKREANHFKGKKKKKTPIALLPEHGHFSLLHIIFQPLLTH